MKQNWNEDNGTFNEKNNSFEPGAARFGNFINYYTFNSVSQRLKVIPNDFLELLGLKSNPILCLDIGCNSGEMTSGLYSHLKLNLEEESEIIILGIDLDDVLVTRCTESNGHPNHIIYEQIDIMGDAAITRLESFLKKHNRSDFDLITCFSTTMWIHLNHGDKGLDDFLLNVSRITKFLLLEPQEWKSYKSAIRRLARLNCEVFALSKLKTRDIVHHFTHNLSSECNMDLMKCFGETSWGRRLFLFQKRLV